MCVRARRGACVKSRNRNAEGGKQKAENRRRTTATVVLGDRLTDSLVPRNARRDAGPLTKEQGVWVFRCGLPLPASATDEVLQQIREERDLANFGSHE